MSVQAGYQPPPVRPPLSPREKSGARLAGIVGFLLLSLGFGLLAIPLSLLALGALFATVLGFIGRVSRDDRGIDQFIRGFEQFNPSAWILPLVIAAIVGLVIMAVALFVSAGILRSHDIARPWAVTWAGAGIAIVGSWLLSGLTAVPAGLFGSFRGDDSAATVGIGVAVAVVSFLVGLFATAVIGWLSWWWMAHALRRPVAPALVV